MFGNNYGYGYGGYNPTQMYSTNANAINQPQYQPSQYQQPQYQQTQMPIGLKGRTVENVEEVRATQIDLDGSKTYFPCPAAQAIFVKYIGMDGNAVIETFTKAAPTPPKQYAELAALQTLEKRLDDLEASLK